MNKSVVKKIFEHPNKDEIIAKLLFGESSQDVHNFLATKYKNSSELKFVLNAKIIQNFKDNYLDIYSYVREDILKTQLATSNSLQEELELSVKNNSAYKDKLLEITNNEIDVRKMLARMILAIETRTAQLYDRFQMNPDDVSTREERLMLDYFDKLGIQLERYQKYLVGTPDTIIQHNITISQDINLKVKAIQEAICETASEIDIETSMLFMDKINKKLSALNYTPEKIQNPTERLAEVKLLNEEINTKLNE